MKKHLLYFLLCACMVRGSDEKKCFMIPVHGIYHEQKAIDISSLDRCPITTETVEELLQRASPSKPVLLYSLIQGRPKDKGFIYSADDLKYWWRKKSFDTHAHDFIKDPLTKQSVAALYPIYWDAQTKTMWSPLGEAVDWLFYFQQDIQAEAVQVALTLQKDAEERLQEVVNRQVSMYGSLEGSIPHLQAALAGSSHALFSRGLYERVINALERSDVPDEPFLIEIAQLSDDIVDYHDIIHQYGYACESKQFFSLGVHQCVVVDDLFVQAKRQAQETLDALHDQSGCIKSIASSLMGKVKEEALTRKNPEDFLYVRYLQLFAVEKLLTFNLEDEAYELLLLTPEDLEASIVFLHSPLVQLKKLFGRRLLAYCQVLIEKDMSAKALPLCKLLEGLFKGDIKSRAASLRKSIQHCCGIM
jgi:hypothetical protein